MSRLINTTTHDLQDKSIRDTKDGRLLLTNYMSHDLALLISDNRLLHVSVLEQHTGKVGAVYLSKIKNVVKNINACFAEIEGGELVFLPLELCKNAFIINRPPDGRILEGDDILIQITRDALKTKQAAATTEITLTGRYFVMNTGSSRIGISSKLSETTRIRLANLLQEYNIANDKMRFKNPRISHPYGLVVRTEAADASAQDIIQEFVTLHETFVSIFERALHSTCFTCLKPAPDSWEAVLDQLPAYEYNQVITDVLSFKQKTESYFAARELSVRFYEDDSYPLCKLYGIEYKLEEALARRVWLKSGAYLVIDITEALVVFDVNSGKYEARKASSETFYQINLEAATEIARQIRLRNLSGIILIDFINMDDTKQKESLLEHMRSLVKKDRIHTKVVDITPLGLMELTRKKVNKPLADLLK